MRIGGLFVLATMLAPTLLAQSGVAQPQGTATGQEVVPTVSQPKAPEKALKLMPLPKSKSAQATMKRLRGKWKLIDGEDVFDFKDGQLLKAESPAVSLDAVYTVSEKGELEILLGLPGASKITRQVKFGKNTLELTDKENASTLKYKKIH